MDHADWEEFQLIATDGGYTISPQTMKSNMIGPGARDVILLDLTSYAEGDSLYLRNVKQLLPGSVVGSPDISMITNWPGPQGARDTTIGDAFLQLKIIANPQDYTPVTEFNGFTNAWDPAIADTFGITNRRTKDLVYMDQIILEQDTFKGFTIDSTTYNLETINDVICEGAKEVWTIHNKTTIAHPFHIHKIFFRILDIDSMGFAIPLAERGFNGPKDDVLVLPNWRLRFMAKFDDYPSPIDDYTQSYMYHCHILTHEDQEGGGMMHQFVVTSDPSCTPVDVEEVILEENGMLLFPNPAGNELFMAGKSNITSTVRVVDIQGRTIKQQQLGAFEGQVPIDISGLQPGMYVVLWCNERGETARKLVVR
jgi:FtsP/CotA-like multicopper oxidase with cupredoxin domain